MNKAQNTTNPKDTSHLSQIQPIIIAGRGSCLYSPARPKKQTKEFQSQQQFEKTMHSEFYVDRYKNLGQEETMVKFSRFANWHLSEMGDNRLTHRQNWLQNSRNTRNVQQQNELNSQVNDDHQKISKTPATQKSYLHTQKLSNIFSSPIQNNKISQLLLLNSDKIMQIKNKQRHTGLRKLSYRAYEIVKEIGSVTYKDVASRLIREIVEQEEDFDDGKEENNIKRRVYDALNVLIAMNILKKQGKSIIFCSQNRQSRIKAQQKIIADKKSQIQKKKKQKQRLEEKRAQLQNMINRNKNMQTNIEKRISVQNSQQVIILQIPTKVHVILSQTYEKIRNSQDTIKIPNKKEERVKEIDYSYLLFAQKAN